MGRYIEKTGSGEIAAFNPVKGLEIKPPNDFRWCTKILEQPVQKGTPLNASRPGS